MCCDCNESSRLRLRPLQRDMEYEAMVDALRRMSIEDSMLDDAD